MAHHPQSIQDKKLKGKLRATEAKIQKAALNAQDAELMLETDAGYLEAEGMEKTWKFNQTVLEQHADLNTRKKVSERN